MAEKTYYANWTLDFDGETFERGDAVKMDEKIAAPLLGGVLSVKKPSDTPDSGGEGDVAKIAALEAQVKDLETQLNTANAKLAQGNKAELVAKIAALEAQVKDLETKLAAAGNQQN
jgi:uncharacterized protein YceH (UPF0502 family)